MRAPVVTPDRPSVARSVDLAELARASACSVAHAKFVPSYIKQQQQLKSLVCFIGLLCADWSSLSRFPGDNRLGNCQLLGSFLQNHSSSCLEVILNQLEQRFTWKSCSRQADKRSAAGREEETSSCCWLVGWLANRSGNESSLKGGGGGRSSWRVWPVVDLLPSYEY